MVSEVSKDTVSASSDGWVSHDPRYGGGYRPCDADLVVEVSDTRKENVRVDRAGDIFWGYGSDCEHPVWFWRPVNPQPHKPQSGASSDAVERLEAYALGQSRYKAWRGEAPAGEPTLRRDLMLAVSTLRSQAEALEKAREAMTASGSTKAAYHGEFKFQLTQWREDDDGEPEEYLADITVPWTTVKEIMAAIAARAALTPEVKS